MSDSVVKLTFPAKADYLLLARLALSGLARAYPFEPELLADLKLAVTEACGNAVRHAYVDESGTVTVGFALTDDRIEMVVADEGTGVGVPDLDEVSLPDHLESGMGMAIIREIVDELRVEDGADGRGTVVRMTKYLAPVA